jgi:7,8-dihydroneopterin aldolase/epimerase/oxygenase
MSDRIYLHEMVFMGRHGVTDEERAEAQQIEVDLDVALDLSVAGRTDDLSDTVDYAELFTLCRDVVEERSFHLLEGIAEAIAADVLAHHPRIERATVRVKKPGLPIEGEIEHAGVVIERGR